MIQLFRELVDSDGAICKIVGFTTNTVNVWIEKKTSEGISCSNWFIVDDKFFKRFKVK